MPRTSRGRLPPAWRRPWANLPPRSRVTAQATAMTSASPRRQTDAELAARFIERTRNEPLWFCEEVLNHRALPGEPSLAEDATRSWELDSFQRDLLNAVADIWREKTLLNHERKTNLSVVAGHGPGKTHTAALIAHYFNACW